MTSSVRLRSLILLVLASLLAGLVAAPVSAAAPPGKGKPTPGKAVFFAADGMRQDLVAKYAAAGLMPTMGAFLKNGTSAARQRSADPGAAEHRRRLVHARDRRLAGRPRLHEQHVPQERRRVRDRLDIGVRPGRAPGGVDRPVRASGPGSRSRRSSGRAGATRRSRAPRSTSRASSPAVASPPTSSAPPADALFDDAPFISAFGLQFDHKDGYPAANRAAGPVGRDRPRRRLDGRPRVVQPGQGDAPPRPDGSDRQVRPQRLHLRQHERLDRRTTTRSSSRGRGAAPRPTRSGRWRRASGPTSRSSSTSPRSPAATRTRSTARPPACSSRSRS